MKVLRTPDHCFEQLEGYLYRKMIPVLTAKGFRVLAPDLPGFGRSDKPTERSDYTYQRHVDWMTRWLHQVDVSNVVLFCQDWGGLIGLRLVAEQTELFSGVVASNTERQTPVKRSLIGKITLKLCQCFLLEILLMVQQSPS